MFGNSQNLEHGHGVSRFFGFLLVVSKVQGIYFQTRNKKIDISSLFQLIGRWNSFVSTVSISSPFILQQTTCLQDTVSLFTSLRAHYRSLWSLRGSFFMFCVHVVRRIVASPRHYKRFSPLQENQRHHVIKK